MSGKWKKLQQAPIVTTANGDTEAPSSSGRKYTLSLALPGSCIEHCPSAEAAAAVAAQIARAAAIFAVDEVVVYEEVPLGGDGSISLGSATLARVLQYLETPPFLRASLFPGSVAYPELRCAAALCPSLQTPHHSRSQEWQSYREGVVMRSEPDTGSFVDIGYERNAHVDECLPVGRRVTLHLGSSPSTTFVPAFSETMLKARLARPSEPRTQQGTYWGFSVRVATSLSRVLKEPGFKAGYDLSVGTARQGAVRQVAELVLPTFKHALVVLGGTQELEAIVAGDAALAQAGKGAADLFSLYLNCCPGQATASIRSEDAAILCLAYLHASLLKYGA
ncbi:putative RNA methyltransferase [Haematococcus lacustris]